MSGAAFTCFWCVSLTRAWAGKEPNWIKTWNGFFLYKGLREEISASFCFSWYSSHLLANCFSCGVARHSLSKDMVSWGWLPVNVSSVLTLQRWKPPQSFAGGCWGSESCSRRRRGKSCAPGHKMPCHYSSWMRNSEYPHAEKKTRIKTEAAISYGNIPKAGVYD